MNHKNRLAYLVLDMWFSLNIRTNCHVLWTTERMESYFALWLTEIYYNGVRVQFKLLDFNSINNYIRWVFCTICVRILINFGMWCGCRLNKCVCCFIGVWDKTS